MLVYTIRATEIKIRSRGSSGSIVSEYGLHDRAIGVRSPVGAKDFSSILCVQTGSEVHPASCTMGTGGSFPWGAQRDRGMTLTTHPHLVPRSRMSRSFLLSTQAPTWRVAGLLCFEIKIKLKRPQNRVSAEGCVLLTPQYVIRQVTYSNILGLQVILICVTVVFLSLPNTLMWVIPSNSLRPTATEIIFVHNLIFCCHCPLHRPQLKISLNM
jgi:hypothetical protein